MNDENLEREYTLREIRMIEARQRERRRERQIARFRENLPVIGLVALGIAAVALAVMVGVN